MKILPMRTKANVQKDEEQKQKQKQKEEHLYPPDSNLPATPCSSCDAVAVPVTLAPSQAESSAACLMKQRLVFF